MKTEDLIEKLSANVSPVNRNYPVFQAYIGWLIFAISFVMFFIWNRSESFQYIYFPTYWHELIPVSLSVLISSFFAIHLSVPGNRIKKNLKLLTTVLFIAWSFFIGARFFIHNFDSAQNLFKYHSCFRDILLMSFPLSVVLIFIVNKRNPFQKKWTGFWIVAASSSASGIGVSFLCPNEAPSHLLSIHAMPVLLLGIIGIILGSLIFRDL